MDTEELEHKRTLLRAYQRRQRERQVQLAQYGVAADPVITTEIADLQTEIEKLECEITQARTDTQAPPRQHSPVLGAQERRSNGSTPPAGVESDAPDRQGDQPSTNIIAGRWRFLRVVGIMGVVIGAMMLMDGGPSTHPSFSEMIVGCLCIVIGGFLLSH